MTEPCIRLGLPGNPNRIQLDGPISTLSWFFGWSLFANADTPHNNVFSIGWNITDAGNPEDDSEPIIFDSWESNFQVGSDRFMERHWQYRNAASTISRRMLSASVDRLTHACKVAVNGKFDIFASAGTTQVLEVKEDGLVTLSHIGANTGLYFPGIDHPCIFLHRTTGGAGEVLRAVTGNIFVWDANQIWNEERHQALKTSWYPGGLTRGYVDSTAWQFQHQIRIGYVTAEFGTTTLSANVDDWAPSNLAISNVLVFTDDGSPHEIRGITGAANGRPLWLYNMGTATHTIKNEAATSSAANRLRCTGGVDTVIQPGELVCIMGIHDGSVLRWHVPGRSRMADIGALVDNISGTLSDTLASIPDPADSPLLADTLRDDIVTNVLPAIRNALSSIADAFNDLRTELRNSGRMA